jgi:hypothetical protein
MEVAVSVSKETDKSNQLSNSCSLKDPNQSLPCGRLYIENISQSDLHQTFGERSVMKGCGMPNMCKIVLQRALED